VIDARQRWVAQLLIAVGAGLLLWLAAHLFVTASHRREYDVTLENRRASAAQGPDRSGPISLVSGEPLGTLQIARIGLSGVVVEGDGEGVLDRAIGHLPDTPLPWQNGNSALAAHRDALFRPLKDIREGDLIRLSTPYGDFDYRVRETLVVAPEDLWVLDPTPTTMITLISCYPFHYVGPAPKRFIVRAERVS
jgi:sortase A